MACSSSKPTNQDYARNGTVHQRESLYCWSENIQQNLWLPHKIFSQTPHLVHFQAPPNPTLNALLKSDIPPLSTSLSMKKEKRKSPKLVPIEQVYSKTRQSAVHLHEALLHFLKLTPTKIQTQISAKPNSNKRLRRHPQYLNNCVQNETITNNCWWTMTPVQASKQATSPFFAPPRLDSLLFLSLVFLLNSNLCSKTSVLETFNSLTERNTTPRPQISQHVPDPSKSRRAQHYLHKYLRNSIRVGDHEDGRSRRFWNDDLRLFMSGYEGVCVTGIVDWTRNSSLARWHLLIRLCTPRAAAAATGSAQNRRPSDTTARSVAGLRGASTVPHRTAHA